MLFLSVVERVHKAESFIYLQIWALGRAGYAEVLKRDGFPHVSASDVELEDRGVPRPLTIPEIEHYISLFAKAGLYWSFLTIRPVRTLTICSLLYGFLVQLLRGACSST